MQDDKQEQPTEENAGGGSNGGECGDPDKEQYHEHNKDNHDGDGDDHGADDRDDDNDDDDGYDEDDYLEDGYEDDRDKDYPADYDLEYLKQFQDDDDDWEDESEKGAKSPWVRLVSLVTVLAFLALALAVSWPSLPFPLAELVGRSVDLQQDSGVRQLQAPVVQINVVARQGASIGAANKSGTGFNIEPEGLIVTNRHVIDGALNMTITFTGGKIYKAQSWHVQSDYDLAVIKLQGKNLPVAPVNGGGYPKLGDKVRVVGNPMGFNDVVADGAVDGYVRVGDSPEPVFSIDAPVYPGNSGSPVYNSDGEVIGVVFATYQKEVNGQAKTCGLAVPIGFLKKTD